MPDVSLFEHVERLRDAMTTDGWRQAIRSLFTVYAPDLISAVRCPIATLSGTLDQVAPHQTHAERLLAAAPWATSHAFEDCTSLSLASWTACLRAFEESEAIKFFGGLASTI